MATCRTASSTLTPFSPAQLVRAANFSTRHFAGLPLDQVRVRLTDELKRLREDIVVC